MRYKLSISSDGTPRNTHIMIGGRELKGVVKIEIKPINTKGPITARITVASVSLSLRNINTEIVWADLNGNGSDKERENAEHVIPKGFYDRCPCCTTNQDRSRTCPGLFHCPFTPDV